MKKINILLVIFILSIFVLYCDNSENKQKNENEVLKNNKTNEETTNQTEFNDEVERLIKTKNCPKCALIGAILFEKDLSGANLKGANLSGGADISSTNLIEADLSNADLSLADIRDSELVDANFENAKLENANLTASIGKNASFKNANLKNAILRGINLTNANLQGADLSGANLNYAVLIGADLTGADLTEASLLNANLTNAILTDTILKDIDTNEETKGLENVSQNNGENTTQKIKQNKDNLKISTKKKKTDTKTPVKDDKKWVGKYNGFIDGNLTTLKLMDDYKFRIDIDGKESFGGNIRKLGDSLFLYPQIKGEKRASMEIRVDDGWVTFTKGGDDISLKKVD